MCQTEIKEKTLFSFTRLLDRNSEVPKKTIVAERRKIGSLETVSKSQNTQNKMLT
jgi:hypothetical protein